jgi:tetratricopeptide (TPR) repeat protein
MTAPTTLTDLENQLHYLDQPDVPTPELVDTLYQLARRVAETDPTRAEALCRRALSLCTVLMYRPAEVRALTLLAWLNLVQGRMDLALTRALNAEAVARVIREPQLEGHAVYVISLIHEHVGNAQAVRQAHYKLIAIARETDDGLLEANCLLAMGTQHTRQNEHREALHCSLQALALYRRVALNGEGHLIALNNAASAYIQTGDVWSALQHAQKALALCQPNQLRVYTQILHTLGNVHAAMGQLDEALVHFTRALDLNAQAAQNGDITDREFEVTVQLDVAKVQRALNQPAPSFAALQCALEVAQTLDAKPLLAQTHDQLSQAYREAGQVALALAHAEEREAARSSLRQITTERHAKVTRLLTILQASRQHVHQEQCQAAHEWLWQSCLHGNAATC